MQLDGYEKKLVEIALELSYYLQKIGASPEDAQDVAQDALLKLLEIENVIAPEMFRPWLYRVGINRFFNLSKRQQTFQKILQLHFFREFQVELEVDYEFLYRAFQELNPKEKNLLLLKYDEKLSIEAMAFLLNRPKDSLKTELYRARKKLKSLIEEFEKEAN